MNITFYITALVISLFSFTLFLKRKIAPEISAAWIITGITAAAGIYSATLPEESRLRMVIGAVFTLTVFIMISAQLLILAAHTEKDSRRLKKLAQAEAIETASRKEREE